MQQIQQNTLLVSVLFYSVCIHLISGLSHNFFGIFIAVFSLNLNSIFYILALKFSNNFYKIRRLSPFIVAILELMVCEL